jgi:hypothetical protein
VFAKANRAGRRRIQADDDVALGSLAAACRVDKLALVQRAVHSAQRSRFQVAGSFDVRETARDQCLPGHSGRCVAMVQPSGRGSLAALLPVTLPMTAEISVRVPCEDTIVVFAPCEKRLTPCK